MLSAQRRGQPPQRHHHDKAAAWALILGIDLIDNRNRGRRPHRGQLPDVLLPPPPPRGPSLLKRVKERVLRMFRPGVAADTTVSAADDAPLGEWIDPAHVRAIEAMREAEKAGPKAKPFEDLAA